MCGRYTYYSSEEIVEDLELSPEVSSQLELVGDNFNVSPGMLMPVIVRGEQEHNVELMQWGLIPSWSKAESTGLKLINARREGLFEKPMWKRLVKNHRCIVPARGFYEWQRTVHGKQPYYITPKTGKVFSFAGLWDEWTNDNGEKIKTYTIITTAPNSEMSELHNRMPAILDKHQADLWLSPLEVTESQVDDILKSAPDNSLILVKVSSEVNSPRNNYKSLIYPLDD